MSFLKGFKRGGRSAVDAAMILALCSMLTMGHSIGGLAPGSTLSSSVMMSTFAEFTNGSWSPRSSGFSFIVVLVVGSGAAALPPSMTPERSFTVFEVSSS